jgi:hypothetical protein
MQRVAVLFVFAVVILSVPGATPVAAQERGDTGITMGYPASVGLVWHVTDRIAIRPELSFSVRNTEDRGLQTANSDTTAFGVGVSGLFYVRQWDKLRAYVAPRYTYARATAKTDLSDSAGTEIELHSTTHTVFGSFGAQYSLAERFSVYGEVGVAHSNGSGRSELTPNRTDTSAFSSQSGIGVTFYF